MSAPRLRVIDGVGVDHRKAPGHAHAANMRVIVWVAMCACGWESEEQPTHAAADREYTAHRLEQLRQLRAQRRLRM